MLPAASGAAGAAAVYRAELDDAALTSTSEAGAFVDAATGSRWSLLGRATSGLLAGRQLDPVVHVTPFWFAWAAFAPATRIDAG